jgi:hypothetical protein
MTTMSAPIDLSTAVTQPHEAALSGLTTGANPLITITWTSVHLAAVERVLYPAIARRLPGSRMAVRRLMAVDHRLQNALWRLDRRVTGDVRSSSLVVDDLVRQVRDLLAEHAHAEEALLAELQQVLADEEQAALIDRLAGVICRAPTRPHPNTPHSRVTDALAFRIESWCDSIRDSLDCRSIPSPRRVRAPHPIGRWGAYLTAQPFYPQALQDRDAAA